MICENYQAQMLSFACRRTAPPATWEMQQRDGSEPDGTFFDLCAGCKRELKRRGSPVRFYPLVKHVRPAA